MNELVLVLLVAFSLAAHERAHAYVATQLGDPMPFLAGRLTWNPFVQLHPISSLLLPVLTQIVFGVPIGWGRAVPVDYRRIAHRHPTGPLLVAFVGPLTNWTIAFCTAMLGLATGWRVLEVATGVNILLGLVNLLPVPPLDGWVILTTITAARRKA